MGACSSSDAGLPSDNQLTPVNRKDMPSISTAIDKDLITAKRSRENIIKFILLGAGESGKSTIFKQMRILYGSPRSDDDLRSFGVVVRSNIIVVTRKLCTLIRLLDFESGLDDEEINDGISPREAYETLVEHLVTMTAPEIPPAQDENGKKDWVGEVARAGISANNDAKLLLHLWKQIRVLWQTSLMKEVWAKRSQLNIIDSHKEYLQDIERIASPEYHPTTQDILLSRVRTTQVIMERYVIQGTTFEMYDAGGQRAERRKWLDCFDNVDAVIFVAALSEYDQYLAEAKRQNRMVEALTLFRNICNNRAFESKSIMLFLNKRDIFTEKIMETDIASQPVFRDYEYPPKSYHHGVMYFIQKFKDCVAGNFFDDQYIHVTCATDTNNMEFVLDATRMIIMTQNLVGSGILGG